MFKAAISTLVLLAASTSFATNSTYLCTVVGPAGSPHLKVEISRNESGFSGLKLSGETKSGFVTLATADSSFQNPEHIVRDFYSLKSPSAGTFSISNNLVDYFAASNGQILMQSNGARYTCQGI